MGIVRVVVFICGAAVAALYTHQPNTPMAHTSPLSVLILASVLVCSTAVPRVIDSSGDGSVSEAEKTAALEALNTNNIDKGAWVDQLSTDGQGGLSKTELQDGLGHIGLGEMAGELHAILDTDTDGLVIREEFKAMDPSQLVFNDNSRKASKDCIPYTEPCKKGDECCGFATRCLYNGAGVCGA